MQPVKVTADNGFADIQVLTQFGDANVGYDVHRGKYVALPSAIERADSTNPWTDNGLSPL
jgi:hypothetical protein